MERLVLAAIEQGVQTALLPVARAYDNENDVEAGAATARANMIRDWIATRDNTVAAYSAAKSLLSDIWSIFTEATTQT